MKRKSTATEEAAKKHNSVKRGRASGTATEHATSGNATEHAALASDIKDSRGPATEHADCPDDAHDRLEEHFLATATEHGYCPDDAHEPLEEYFVDTPVFDVDTEYIRIGPCILHWQCAGGLQLGILRALQREIQNRFRMPVSLERFIRDCLDNPEQDWSRATQSRSWSGCVEAISRCVAAFQAATDATEHSRCQDIARILCIHPTALTRKTQPLRYIREYFLTLVYEYIENRTYNTAFKNLLNLTFGPVEYPFWTRVGQGEQRCQCLTIIQICTEDLKHKAEQLQDEMRVYSLATEQAV